MFVKICGITSEEDALLAVAMGADAVGFVFAPSRRQLAATQVRDIVRRLPPDVLTVGVFRDESPERVVELVNISGVRAAQLHGHENAEHTQWVRHRVPVVFKAFPAGDPQLDHFDDYGADAALIDSPVPGSGQIFDWSLAEGAPAGRRVIIAGGLTPDNVAAAVTRIQPWGVDVASGVEIEGNRTGRKDARKIRKFVQAARAAQDPGHQGADDLPYDWMTE